MNLSKHVAGIALFIFIVGSSVLIVSMVAAPLQMIPPVQIKEPLSVSRTGAKSVAYTVQLVSLDFINRESYTTLRLKRDTRLPAPDTLWVSTYFFVPEFTSHGWSSAPVEIQDPFAGGDEVSLTLTGACPLCADANAPRSGYYARVGVSTVSGIAAQSVAQADSKTPIPVLVQAERKSRR